MARRSQCSSDGDNPLNPNYLPPHYREEYRLAIDALVEEDLEGYYQFLQRADVVDFLSRTEIEYIQGTVQVPQRETGQQPELRYLDCDGDGSSDTYWPVHSDLDAPGLDLGWPEEFRFIGPTEVTTLVNPAEPNMPSIKEQARRLIKNAQQVIAVVMDMFTDVDIFADILGAAMRNVAVYILLDEQNAHHFINMVLSCRVNLETIPFLRVRTVSGITYRYRSGKTLKGQMMDRFLLTDCRAVLSGNYSFMWSFEKLHRCLAHLFLGQLVTTFDEEFRILFAQSQPLIIENVLAQMEDLSHVPDKQHSGDRTALYRDTRKVPPPLDISQPEDWARYSYDERADMDWKKTPLGRHESIQRSREPGPGDMYNRYSSQQPRTEQPYEQGHSRMPINLMESAGLKRHSYAEGGHGRDQPYQFMQQPGKPNLETQGRQFQREQQTYPRTGPETGYSGYDRLWGQGYHPMDQYPPEPGFPQEMEPPDSFDPVANYLSSTSNVELDQGSDKLLPPGEGNRHPKRQSVGQPYACQTSPTAPNPPDQKQFFPESNTDRKDPSVKQGLRDWRISSYLSAFDDTGDEDPPLQPPMATDPFEEPPKPFQRRSSVPELSVLKIPNTREFKIPAVPRVSQLPNYMKPTALEPSKNVPDYYIPMAAETKTTPSTLSESSSTTEGDKAEGVELKEPKDTAVRRDESFRRKYNAAVQRSSRLRSSLIFSSQLEQQDSDELKIASGQPDEETAKIEEESELPYASKVLSQRRPYEWTRYLRSATFDNATTEASKADDAADKADIKDLPKQETSKDLLGNIDIKEPSKPAETELTKVSHAVPAPNPSQVQPLNLFANQSYLDMNDPDQRLVFFKQLAAKQRAAKAAAAEKSTEEALPKPPSETKHAAVKKEEPARDEVSQNRADSFVKKPATTAGTLSEKKTPPDGESNTSTETHGTVGLHLDVKGDTNKSEKRGNRLKSNLNASPCGEKEQKGASTDSEKIEWKNSQANVSTPVSSGSHSQPPEEPKVLSPAVKDRSPSHPPITEYAKSSPLSTPTDPVGQRIDESPALDSTSKDPSSTSPNSAELPPSSKPPTLESNVQPPGQLPLESSISSPIKLSESHGAASPLGSESSSPLSIPPASISSQNIQSECSSPVTLTEASSENIPPKSSSSKNIPSESNSAPHSTRLEPVSSQTTPSDSTCTPPSTTSQYSPPPSPHKSVLSPQSDKTERNKSLCPSPTESPQTSIQASLQPNISSGPCANDSEPNTASFKSSTKKDNEESHTPKSGADESLLSPKSTEPGSKSITNAVSVESRSSSDSVLSYPKDVKNECSVSPSLSNLSSDSLQHNESRSRTISDVESSILSQRPGETEPLPSPNLPPSESSPDPPPTETSLVPSPSPPKSSSSPSSASSGLKLTQTSSLSEHAQTGSSSPSLPTTVVCHSPGSVPDGSIVSPRLEKTETITPTDLSPSETGSLAKRNPTDRKSLIPTSTESPSSSDPCLTEPTPEDTPAPSEPDLGRKSPTESKSSALQGHPSKPPVHVENNNVDNQCEVSDEPERTDSVGEEKADAGKKTDAVAADTVNKTTPQESARRGKPSEKAKENNSAETTESASAEVIPLSPQPKQPKANQSRYHSSTAGVLASSNLRDDTKLLLEQISANSQSRTEPTKASSVTDDEKEDDKSVGRDKQGGRSLAKVPSKTPEEREKLLEKIQSMRKERKVYSRFDMGH